MSKRRRTTATPQSVGAAVEECERGALPVLDKTDIADVLRAKGIDTSTELLHAQAESAPRRVRVQGRTKRPRVSGEQLPDASELGVKQSGPAMTVDDLQTIHNALLKKVGSFHHPLDKPQTSTDARSAHEIIMHAIANDNLGCLPELHLTQAFRPMDYYVSLTKELRPSSNTVCSDDILMHEVSRAHFQERMHGYTGQEGELPCIFYRADRQVHRANDIASASAFMHGDATKAVGCQFSALCMTLEHTTNPHGIIPGVAYRTPDDIRTNAIRRGACIMCLWVSTASMLYSHNRDRLPTHPAGMPGHRMRTAEGQTIPVCINPFYVRTGVNEFLLGDCLHNPDNLLFGPFPQFSERFLRCAELEGGVPGFELVTQSFRCRNKEAAREAIQPGVRMYTPPASSEELLSALFRRIGAATSCDPALVTTWEASVEACCKIICKGAVLTMFPPVDRARALIDECLQILPDPAMLPPPNLTHLVVWMLYLRVHEAMRGYVEKQESEFNCDLHALRLFVQAHRPLAQYLSANGFPPDDQVFLEFPWHTDAPDTVLSRSVIDQQLLFGVPSVPIRMAAKSPSEIMFSRADVMQFVSAGLKTDPRVLFTIAVRDFEAACYMDMRRSLVAKLLSDEFVRLPWADASENRVTCTALVRVGIAYAVMRACVAMGQEYSLLFDTMAPLSVQMGASTFGRTPQLSKHTPVTKSQNSVNRDRAFDIETEIAQVNTLFAPAAPVRYTDATHTARRVLVRSEHREMFMAAKKVVAAHLDLLTHAITFRTKHGRFPSAAEWMERADNGLGVSPLMQHYPWEHRGFHPGNMADHADVLMHCAVNDVTYPLGVKELLWTLYKACNIFHSKNGHPLAIPFEECQKDEEMLSFITNLAYFTYVGLYPSSCTFVSLQSWLHFYALLNPWSPVAAPRRLPLYLTKHTLKIAVQEHMLYQITTLPFAMPIIYKQFYNVNEAVANLLFSADNVRLVNACCRHQANTHAFAEKTYMQTFRCCLPKFPSEDDAVSCTLIAQLRASPNAPLVLSTAGTKPGKRHAGQLFGRDATEGEYFTPPVAERLAAKNPVTSQCVLKELAHLNFENDLLFLINHAMQVLDAFVFPCTARSAPFVKCIMLLMRAFITADGTTHNKQQLEQHTLPLAYDYPYVYRMMLKMLQAEDDVAEHPPWLKEAEIRQALSPESVFRDDADVFPIGDPAHACASSMDVDISSASDVMRMDSLLNTGKLDKKLMFRTIAPGSAHPVAHVRYELTDEELEEICLFIASRAPQAPLDFSELACFGLSQNVIDYLYHLEDIVSLVPSKNVKTTVLPEMTSKELYTLYAVCAFYTQHYSTGVVVVRCPALIRKQADALQRAMRMPLDLMRSDFATIPVSTQCGRVACGISNTFIGNKGVVQRDGILYPSERRPQTRRALFYLFSTKCSMVPQFGTIVRFPRMTYRHQRPSHAKSAADKDKDTKQMFKRTSNVTRRHGDGGYGAVHRCLPTTISAPLFTFCGVDTRFISPSAFVAPAHSATRIDHKNISHLILADCCGSEVPYCPQLFGQWENGTVLWCGNCYSVYNTRQLSTMCFNCGAVTNQDATQIKHVRKNRVRVDKDTGLFTIFYSCSYCD